MSDNNHGGQREGAGRKPTYEEPMQRKTVTLPRSHVEHLKEVGVGNLSKGIRHLVRRDRDECD